MIARRTILASGAAFVTIGLTGCGHNSPEKKATEKKTTPVRATTTASAPHRSDAVSTEALLADLATKAARSVTDGQLTVLNQVAAAHRRHLEVLSQSNPFSGSTATPSAAISPTPRTAGQGSPLALLQHHEKAAATQYLEICQTAQDSSETLLWASLSVFCSAFNPSAPAPQSTPKVVPVTIGQEPLTNAQQALLTHLNALVAGLEWGIGRLGRTTRCAPGDGTDENKFLPSAQRCVKAFGMHQQPQPPTCPGTRCRLPPSTMQQPGRCGLDWRRTCFLVGAALQLPAGRLHVPMQSLQW
ncbi:hypothetical protein JCM18918_906 [Cutibacterium acnes JCM 18918]|nr:hypothetical protein JCM18918_906 [Cutibacterium acnes JCM 18918]